MTVTLSQAYLERMNKNLEEMKTLVYKEKRLVFLGLGLNSESYEELSASWLIGERLGILKKRGDYHTSDSSDVIFSRSIRIALDSNIFQNVDANVPDDAKEQPEPYRLGKIIRKFTKENEYPYLWWLGTYLNNPQHTTSRDAEECEAAIAKISKELGL